MLGNQPPEPVRAAVMKRRLEHGVNVCRWREDLGGNQPVNALILNFMSSEDMKLHCVSLLYNAPVTVEGRSWLQQRKAYTWLSEITGPMLLPVFCGLLGSPVSLTSQSIKLVFPSTLSVSSESMIGPGFFICSQFVPSGARRQPSAFV